MPNPFLDALQPRRPANPFLESLGQPSVPAPFSPIQEPPRPLDDGLDFGRFGRSLLTGLGSFYDRLLGVSEFMGGNPFGGTDVARGATREALAQVQNPDLPYSSFGQFLVDRPVQAIGETILESAPGAAATIGATALNPALGLGLATATEGVASFENARAAGAGPAQAAAIGGVVGTVNGLLERVGASGVLRSMARSGGLGQALSAATEIPTEIAQEITALAGERAAGQQHDPQEVQDRLLKTAVAASAYAPAALATRASRQPTRDQTASTVRRFFTSSGKFDAFRVGGKDLVDRAHEASQSTESVLGGLRFRASRIASDLETEMARSQLSPGEIQRRVTAALSSTDPDAFALATAGLSESLVASIGGPGTRDQSTARGLIDSLTARALNEEGFVPEGLQEVFQSNLGSYLRREFRVFNEADWKDRVLGEERAERWDPLFSELKSSGAFLPKSLSGNQVDPLDLDPDLRKPFLESDDVPAVISQQEDRFIEAYMLSALDRDPDRFYSNIERVPAMKGFFKRKTVGKAMDSFLGIYDDPSTRVLASASRLGYDLEMFKLHNELWQAGNDRTFFRRPTGDFRERVGGNRGPLKDTYTTPEIAAVIRGTTEYDPGPIMAPYYQAVSAVRLGKTLGNFPRGFIRNAVAWPMIHVANGHSLSVAGAAAAGAYVGGPAGAAAGAAAAAIPLIPKWMKGLKVTAHRAFPKLHDSVVRMYGQARRPDGSSITGPQSLSEARDKLVELIDRGIIDESVEGRSIKDMRERLLPSVSSLDEGSHGARKVFDTLASLWSAGDNLGKTVAFDSEFESLKWALPAVDPADLRDLAAERTRATTPTYTLVPDGIRLWRDTQPLFSDFPLWASEIFRNSKNILKTGLSDITDGIDTGNSKLVALGTRRLVGMTASVAGFGVAMSAASRSISGATDEDTEALRRIVAPWQTNSDFVIFNKADQDVSFVDLSFTNPYSQLRAPIVALMSEGKLQDRMIDAAAESFSDLVGPKILPAALLESYRRYNPKLPIAGQMEYMSSPVRRAGSPGSVDTVVRLAKSMDLLPVKVSAHGQRETTQDVIISTSLGARAQTISLPARLRDEASILKDTRSDISRRLNRWMTQHPGASPEKIQRRREEANAEWRVAYDAMRQTLAAMGQLGLDEDASYRRLRESRVGDKISRSLVRGEYFPLY